MDSTNRRDCAADEIGDLFHAQPSFVQQLLNLFLFFVADAAPPATVWLASLRNGFAELVAMREIVGTADRGHPDVPAELHQLRLDSNEAFPKDSANWRLASATLLRDRIDQESLTVLFGTEQDEPLAKVLSERIVSTFISG